MTIRNKKDWYNYCKYKSEYYYIEYTKLPIWRMIASRVALAIHNEYRGIASVLEYELEKERKNG